MTSWADWVVYVMLLLQVVSGISVAIFYPWGSSWFATSATPYLRSILMMNPEIGYITAMP